ncbi:hypothetical protein D3C81_1904570 [compost metagenome]
MQQGFVQQRDGGRTAQPLETGKVWAQHWPDTLFGQYMYLHVRRPRGFGIHQQRIEPRPTRIKVAFPC